MEMIVKILDQEVKLLKVGVSNDNYYKLTFENEYIVYCYYSKVCKEWWVDIYTDKSKTYQETTLQELPHLPQLAKIIEQHARKDIEITSCIEFMDGGYGTVLSKCVLFDNIEKYFQIRFNMLTNSVKENHSIEESEHYRLIFEEKYNEYTAKFIEIKVSSILKKKGGLGANTKDFCSVLIK